VNEESRSFLKKRTKKLLRVWARCSRRDRSEKNQKFSLLCRTLLEARSTFGKPAFPSTLINHEDAKDTKVHEGRTHFGLARPGSFAAQPSRASRLRGSFGCFGKAYANRIRDKRESFLLLFFKKEALVFAYLSSPDCPGADPKLRMMGCYLG
jgi:hypothetical protein